MFEIGNGRPADLLALASEVDRLQRLATDLMLFTDGHLNIGDHAPVLDNWMRTSRSAACLTGTVWDHPTLPGAGRPIVTSDLCLLVEDMGVARTMSRWYRLGRPYGSKHSS
ncbi:DUF6634 family protein [Tardiphaga sp. 215_C5_N2_1]|uniref:DUF6634 family protein n=1 Tax=Tardiphaga sp. 215_C5_N2_1 TaxID=3240774 RepID=UPI003F8B311F